MIEWGWIVASPLSSAEREALNQARRTVQKTLTESFPEFEWRLPLIFRRQLPPIGRDEPVRHLQEGAQEREAHAWDFALVVTTNDLRAYYQSFALAVPSRALAVAVVSLARLSTGDDSSSDHQRLSRRMAALALHLFGDLNGLWHREAPDAVMHAPKGPAELDVLRRFVPAELVRLKESLDEVADPRLEEAGVTGFAPIFYARAVWRQRYEITSAILQARPWEFPVRLSRLTTAALSALFLLMVTAEMWDLGTSQSPTAVLVLSVLALASTTAFILARQKLIFRSSRPGLTEQIVVANVSATAIVLLGMVTTYALMYGLALLAGLSLFTPELIVRWAPAVTREFLFWQLLVLAAVVSSFCVVIGALGASFEGPSYFKHVIYADEET